MKYIFDASGCSSRNNRYVVEFRKDSTMGEIVESFQLSSPLEFYETVDFIEARQAPLKEKFNLVPYLRKMREGERTESGLGLTSLGWFLDGRGITKRTIDVVLNGKTYKVDPDKLEPLLKSLE